jgi:hypothetical protein
MNIHVCDPTDFDLSLLRNDFLPIRCLPTTYNLEAYNGAILYHHALHVKDRLGGMDVCTSCRTILKKKKQLVNAIANFQYYGRDELPAAVKAASMFDLMMVSRSRATRITHLFNRKPNTPQYNTRDDFSQRYSQGNVAIFAQDVPTVRTFLPPDVSEVQEAMCAIAQART